jgi:hypothetical protein
VKGTHYEARVRPFYNGNKYYLFVNEVFRDIRLVGAPPAAIGKFGGETDNWMWPRHGGDFAVFRIYVNKDNQPAAYAPDNVPYRPHYFFPVSIEGYDPGDFTFVFGYPGTTREYLPAVAVSEIAFTENPARIALRGKRLDILDAAMNTDRLIRIQYTSKSARIANFWKKMMGETRGIRRLDAVAVKREQEGKFAGWAAQNPERFRKYGGILPAFDTLYADSRTLRLASLYFSEAGLAPEFVAFADGFRDLVKKSRD